MMTKHQMMLLFVFACASPVAAQRPAPAAPAAPAIAPAQVPAPAPPPAAATPVPPQVPPLHDVPARTDQPNIRFDIAITDEGGGAAAVKKNLAMVVQGGGRASLRSVGRVPHDPNEPAAGAGLSLNADVALAPWFPTEPNKIHARVTVDYQPYVKGAPLPGSVRAQVDVQLESGRRLVIWQTADPLSDRRTAIEVTATLLK